MGITKRMGGLNGVGKTKGDQMKITDFAVEISKLEGMKVNLSIAQIKEVLRCSDQALGGELYKLIRKAK